MVAERLEMVTEGCLMAIAFLCLHQSHPVGLEVVG